MVKIHERSATIIRSFGAINLQRPIINFTQKLTNCNHRACQKYSTWHCFSDTIKHSTRHEIPELISEARQKLRSKPSSEALKELLLEVIRVEPMEQESLSIMCELLKKLENIATTVNGPGEVVKSKEITIIPYFTTRETHDIYETIVQKITKDNFKFARFVPRFYLQLLSNFRLQNNKVMFLHTNYLFIRYLILLGKDDQVLLVIQSLLKESDGVLYSKEDVLDEVLKVISSIDKAISPSLLSKIYFSFEYDKFSEKSTQKLHSIVLTHFKLYLVGRNQIFGLKPQFISDMKSTINHYLDNKKTDVRLLESALDVTMSDKSLKEEETKALRIILRGIQKNSYCPDSVMSAFIRNDQIRREEKLIELSKFVKSTKIGSSIEWEVFKAGTLNQKTKEIILLNSDQIGVHILNSILSALANSGIGSFPNETQRTFQFFENSFPDIEKNSETFEILFDYGAKKADTSFLKRAFQDGIKRGMDYSKLPKSSLYELFNALASDPQEDVLELFQWSKKIKRFVHLLDSKSYNSLINMMLKHGYIEDAVKSFREELPELAPGAKKLEIDSYPELYSTITQWLLQQEDMKNIEAMWYIYCELENYFQLPFESYFPLIRKFCELGQPDLGFQIFQRIKKLHRLFGTLPPPTSEMYIYLFNCFGDRVYEDGIDTLYSILKMDSNISNDINIMNSLLNAYCNLKEFTRVSEIFDQIISMPYHCGINNETVSIMLKVYTFLSFESTRNFWSSLHRYNILPNQDNLNQYLISHYFHNKLGDALALVESAEERFDLTIDKNIFQSMYGWNQDKGENMEMINSWANSNFSDEWEKAKKKTQLTKNFDNNVEKDLLGMGFSGKEMKLLNIRSHRL
ncbi:hypothetical protein WICMUC_002692 [Wickerhamomyces mucosus]|uniref:Mitochondrial group I intron splicing factor CCM1 n=1 Tax=Wickerhamomyces mucosus TaxID=1378264 RepID=A0A9P8TEK7_9ASCO|nr:hypothetical protein WICMUC_002692 [Wickerhamomyces mucosus]